MPDARDVEKTLRTEKPCEIWGWRAHPKLWNPNSGLPFLQQCLGGILVGPCLELVPYSCRRPRKPWTLGTQDLGDNLLSPRPLDLFPLSSVGILQNVQHAITTWMERPCLGQRG